MYPRATVESRHRAGPEQAVFPVIAPPGLSPNALPTNMQCILSSCHSFAGGRRHVFRWRLTFIPRIGCGGHPASFLIE